MRQAMLPPPCVTGRSQCAHQERQQAGHVADFLQVDDQLKRVQATRAADAEARIL
jgi:hypothetical protein